jgi:hypothetical protein
MALELEVPRPTAGSGPFTLRREAGALAAPMRAS